MKEQDDAIAKIAEDYDRGPKSRERALEACESIERGRDPNGAAMDVGWTLCELKERLAVMGLQLPERRVVTLRSKYEKRSSDSG